MNWKSAAFMVFIAIAVSAIVVAIGAARPWNRRFELKIWSRLFKRRSKRRIGRRKAEGRLNQVSLLCIR